MTRGITPVTAAVAFACFGSISLPGVTSAGENGPDDTLAEVTVEAGRYSSEVTVDGKIPTPLRSIPNSVSVMTSQRILDQHLVTVADALAQVTGVIVVPNDTSQSQYRSRGYALAVMHDGIPSYSAFSGYQQLDLAIYERLEVRRGPAGLLQGSSEPGGTVNLVSKRGLHTAGISTVLSAGRWNDYRAVIDAGAPLNTNGSLRARAVGAFQDRDEFVTETASRKSVAYGAMDWDLTEATSIGASITSQHERTDTPYSGVPAWDTGEQLDLPRSTQPGPPWARYVWNTLEYTLQARHRFTDAWSVTARASRREQSFFFHDAYPGGGVRRADYTAPYARRENDYDYEWRAVDVFANGTFQLLGRDQSLLVGYNRDSYVSSFGGIALTSLANLVRAPFDHLEQLPDFDLPYNSGAENETRQSGFYAQTRLHLAEPLTFVAGLRTTDFNARARNIAPATPTNWKQGNAVDNRFTPYAGLVYDINPTVSAYASYSDIFVPQSTSFKADGDSLEPRVGRQYEVGAKADLLEGKLAASVAVFDLRDRNRSLADTDHPGFFLNAGEVKATGWETEVTGSPLPGIELQAGYTRLDTEYVVAANALRGQQFDIFEPRHSWKLWGIHRPAPGSQPGVTLGLGLTGQSRVESDPLRSQGAYTLVNMLAGYRFGAHLALNLNIANAFDKSYYARLGGTNIYNTFGKPRNYTLSLATNF